MRSVFAPDCGSSRTWPRRKSRMIATPGQSAIRCRPFRGPAVALAALHWLVPGTAPVVSTLILEPAQSTICRYDDDVRRAREAIDGAIRPSPMIASPALSEVTGGEVFLKFENLQFTGSFKERAR